MRVRPVLMFLLALGLSPSPPSPPPSDSSPLRQHERSSLEAAIAALEYRASWSGEELQAPNRAHNLRTYFGAEGVRVHDRTAPGSPLLVALRASQFGRASALAPIPAGELHSEASRVEIRRPGLVEWYENRPDGLEQGFTLAARPAGDGELVLALALDGAEPTLRDGALALRAHASGRRLEYTKLVAFDDAGRVLPSRMELASDREAELHLVVDDAGARYPVVIDPLIGSSADMRIESNLLNAGLGSAIAAAGDVNGDGYGDLIVGLPGDELGGTRLGQALIFHGSAAGMPVGSPGTAFSVITGPAGLTSYARSVAGAGDVNGDGYDDVLIGAALATNGHSFEGVVYVFHGGPSGTGSGTYADADARLESNQSFSSFGEALAGAGDVNGDGYADVVVGAPDYENGEPSEGAVFLFHGGPGGLGNGSPATAATQLEGDVADREFGASVAGAGDVNGDGFADVILGDPTYTSGQSFEGGAFLFLGSAAGIADGAAADANATFQSNLANAFMGESVASAGDVNGDAYADVIVGAEEYSAGQSSEGAAFVFHGGAAGIANGSPTSANARIESDQSGAQLGKSVAGAGDVNGDGYADVIVGAEFYDSGQGDEGGAFVFLGGFSGVGNTTASVAQYHLQADQANANFGVAVGRAGDVNGDGFADVLVGCTGYNGGTVGEGAVLIYHGGGIGILANDPVGANTALLGEQVGARFARSVASAGDVNGDGHMDVIVGAPDYDAGEPGEGAAFLFRGSNSGLFGFGSPIPPTRLESNQAYAGLGTSVAAAGDVDGDGFGDVIVGAPSWSNATPDDSEGAAFVFRGGPDGIASGTPASAHARFEANQADAGLGVAVAGIGDANGDGYADVAVGALSYLVGSGAEGAVFVFTSGPGGFTNGSPANAASTLESDQTDSGFAKALSGAGDVNGDGFADLVIGADLYNTDADPELEGAAFLYLGGAAGIASGPPAVADASLLSDQSFSRFGSSVAHAGDVNGDGFADVIIGGQWFRITTAEEGAAFVFHGGPAGLPSGDTSLAAAVLRTAQFGAFVSSVAGAGDVNADGFSDVIVGSERYGPLDEGAAFVFLGSYAGVPSGAPDVSSGILEGDEASASMGISVAGAGDVNADGFADVIVGATGYGPGDPSAGGAFLYLGNGGELARRLSIQQFAIFGGSYRPAQPWTAATAPLGFTAYQFHPSSEGRRALRAEIEACLPGTPFGDTSCERFLWPATSWLPLNAGELGAWGVADILPSGAGLHRWRMRSLWAPLHVGAPGITPPPKPAHGPWRRLNGQHFEGDIRVLADGDGDGVGDPTDNCPTAWNEGQEDVDADGAGDVCDNCTTVANPRPASLPTWATLTGGQRDDDHDGYGNKCDAKFTTGGLPAVGTADLTQFRASNGKNRATDTCGTSGVRPCAIFDLDEGALPAIGTGDLTRFRALNGKLPGPKCATCPLPCTAGTEGTCGAIP